jgi:hypothetical protein
MSARLFIEGFEADTLGDIDVEFTFSVADITDIERRNTSFSKTLTLPSTARNQQLFGNIFDISVSNDIFEGANIGQNFNPAKQAKAQIFLDNVKIFDGVLRMSKINNLEGNIVYEVNVFGRLRDILDALGDKTLAELDFSSPDVISYDHIYNRASIEESWTRTEWVEGEQNYVYPLVDYAINEGFIYSQNPPSFEFTNFRPAVFATEILKRIFSAAGFVVQAPIFESFFFRKMVLITAEKNLTREVTTLLNQTTNLFDQQVTSVPTFSHLLGFNNVLNEGFTITNSGTRFTWNRIQDLNAGINTSLNLNFRLVFQALQVVTVNTWTVNVKQNGSVIFTDSRNITLSQVGQAVIWDVDISGGITLNTSQFFEVELTCLAVNAGTNIQTRVVINPGGVFAIGNSIPIALQLEEGDEMKIEYTLPKSMKQRDFFKSIITMHNLYVTQDRLQTNVLEIIPYNEFYQAFKNEALDWSDKLDYSQEISITPLSELSAKEYRFSFDDDQDYWSQSYQTKFNQGYGEKREIIDNDFVLETKTVKVLFGAPVLREQTPNLIMIHLYKVDNFQKRSDNFKPRIAYYKPNVPCPNWKISYKFPVGQITYTSYPYAGHLDDPINPTTDLLFGTPREVLFAIGNYPENTNLYTTYYDQLISSIGDRNSRLVEGYMYLTPTDISNLDFRKIIKLGNHFFQLQKVDKYNPMANGLSYVSLFKILAELQPEDFDFILLENDSYMLQENGVNKFYI